MTRRTWEVARGYFYPVVVLALALLPSGRHGRKAGFGLLGIAVAILYFFRDPERETDRTEGVVYAPADGTVTDVELVEDEWVGRAVRVSTFLNLHNVHVNRSPVSGRVVTMKTIKGGYAPALFGGSGENHRLRTELEGARGRAVLVQKAGMIARRITPWIRPGYAVQTGQRVGVIHFGSRTDVLLKESDVVVTVPVGTRVRAGLTELARYRENPGRETASGEVG